MLEDLKRIIQSPSGARELFNRATPHLIERLSEMLGTNVSDVHPGISGVAIACIPILARVAGDDLLASAGAMSRLMIPLFARLSDPRGESRGLAHSALESIRHEFRADALLPLCLRILDRESIASVKTRVALLEFSMSLVADASGFFGGGKECGLFVASMASLSLDRNQDLRQTAAMALVEAYAVHSASIVRELASLTLGECNAVLKVMYPYIPDCERLDRELLDFRRRRDGLQSARTTGPADEYLSVANGADTLALDRRQVPSTPSAFNPDPFNMRGSSAPREQPQRTQAQAPPLRQLDSNSPSDKSPTISSAEARKMAEPSPVIATKQTPRALRPVEKTTADRERLMSLVKQAEGSQAQDVRRTALERLADLASTQPSVTGGLPPEAAVFRNNAALVLSPVARIARHDPSGHVRFAAVIVLRELVSRIPTVVFSTSCGLPEIGGLTAPPDDPAMGPLARNCLFPLMLSDPSHEVSQAAEECLDLLFGKFADPFVGLAVLGPLMTLEAQQKRLAEALEDRGGGLTPEYLAEELQLAIRMASRCIRRMKDMHVVLPAMLPGLFHAFKHASADVRKAVVFCLVDMYMVMGETFTPYLSELSASQLKLVTIYANRIAAKQASTNATTPGRTVV